MWIHVRGQLEGLFSDRIYPNLFSDRFYRDFLAKSGLGPNFPHDLRELSSDQLAKLRIQAKVEARIVVGELARAQSLREATAQGKLLRGPAMIYRLWDSSHVSSKIGIWWFTEEVMKRCRQEVSSTPQDRIKWLRDYLAVSLDWSGCDRIARLILAPSEEIPVVQAVGRPVRQYSKTAWKRSDVSMVDYWRRIDKYFPGGIVQTVLPWIPEDRVKGLPHI